MFPLQIQVTLGEDQVIVLSQHIDMDQIIIGPQEDDYIVIIENMEELRTFTYLVDKFNKKK